MQNQQSYQPPPRLRQDGGLNENSSNAVNDAFLAFHRRQQGAALVATPSIGHNNIINQNTFSPRLTERSLDGPAGRSALNSSDGRSSIGLGSGSTSRGGGGGNMMRGGRGGSPPFRGRGGRGGSPLPPQQGGGRGGILHPPVRAQVTPLNEHSSESQRGGHAPERGGGLSGRGRGIFQLEGRGNGGRGRGRGDARAGGPARSTQPRYDADFDRGEKPKDTSEAPKQLFVAPIGYRATSSAPVEKASEKAAKTTSSNLTKPPADSKRDPSLERVARSIRPEDIPSGESSSKSNNDSTAHASTAPQPVARAGLIERKVEEPEERQKGKGKGKGRDGRDGRSKRDRQRNTDSVERDNRRDHVDEADGRASRLHPEALASKRASIDEGSAVSSRDKISQLGGQNSLHPRQAHPYNFPALDNGGRSSPLISNRDLPDFDRGRGLPPQQGQFPTFGGEHRWSRPSPPGPPGWGRPPPWDDHHSRPRHGHGHHGHGPPPGGWNHHGPPPPPWHHGPPPPPWHHGPPPGPPGHHGRRGPPGHHDEWKDGLPHTGRNSEAEPSDHKADPGTSPIPSSRQLFDPRRDDPMRFALHKGGSGRDQYATDSERLSPSAGGISEASPSVSLRRTLASVNEDNMLDDMNSVASSTPATDELVRELKAEYREILNLERRLQDEDRNAREALAQEGEADESEDEDAYEGEERDDAYWVRLQQSHRRLVDAYHTFMLRCGDPALPPSLQSLPQKYNIPHRLWQNAFHLLLERLRHALPPALTLESQANDGEAAGPVHMSAEQADPVTISLLDHLQDFVFYAYICYSNLLEDLPLASFRNAWIEQLGDVARYRMAIAGLSARFHPAPASSAGKQSQPGPNVAMKPSPRPVNRSVVAAPSSKKGRQRATGPQRIDDSELEDAETPGGNSIGAAAIDDWELHEQETWRAVAREWYFRGLEEAPGTGRLHHHLALLSKDDQLKSLYHFCKSLTASHPFLAARDTMLAFFEPHKQSGGFQPGSPIISLFVRLHKMLFTQVELDDFEQCLEQFFSLLDGDSATRKINEHAPKPHRPVQEPALGHDSTWIMMAVINIAAVLQYGAQYSVLRTALLVKAGPSKGLSKDATAKSSDIVKRPALGNEEAGEEEPIDGVTSSMASLKVSVEQDGARSINHPEDENLSGPEEEDDDLPPAYRSSLKLLFALLKYTTEQSLEPNGMDPAVCPYIPIVLTFLSTVLHVPGISGLVEREVPWESLVSLYDKMPNSARVTLATAPPNRLLGMPLPEDWAIRGMDWTGRQLFGRGYWKGKLGSFHTPSEGASAYSMPESEADVLNEHYEGPSMPPHAGGPAADVPGRNSKVALHDVAGEDGEGTDSSARETVARLRWKRVALSAAWLSKVTPGFLVDAKTGLVSIGNELQRKMNDWAGIENGDLPEQEGSDSTELEHGKEDQEQAKVEQRDNESGDDEDETRESDSDAVKELKKRRRELKALLAQSREQVLENRSPNGELLSSDRRKGGGRDKKGSQRALLAVPGYTTIVFDTNILLESFELFVVMLESKKWILVVPLAVITELDGLKTKTNALGSAAKQAIAYLETSIRPFSSTLKIQTSRGNYLRDLNIRSEDIDFASLTSTSTTQHSHSKARTMDDVIVYAAKWQEEHWMDRRNLLPPGALDPEERSRKVGSEVMKTVLVSSDRNLRLKARARGLSVADAKELERAVKFAEGKREGYPNG